MLTRNNEWKRIAEINPPELPEDIHVDLFPAWKHVLVTDNVFGRIRLSPYAFSARITHDVPHVKPTVVVSTRDRNILAIESEVRGALMNGVDSFLVVIGDTVPHVDHLAHHYEIVDHLTDLQKDLPSFEVGMPTRFQEWQFRRRIELGTQFFVCGPVLDPISVEEQVGKLNLGPDDPPVFLMAIPPFSADWVDRMESMGAVPTSDGFKEDLSDVPSDVRRKNAWEMIAQMEERAQAAGCAGLVLMGLKFESVVKEAPQVWLKNHR